MTSVFEVRQFGQVIVDSLITPASYAAQRAKGNTKAAAEAK